MRRSRFRRMLTIHYRARSERWEISADFSSASELILSRWFRNYFMFRFLTSWRISCYTILCKFSFGWSLYVILFSFNWPIPSHEQENERKAKTKRDVIYLPKWFLSSSLKRTCWLKFFTLHPAVSCWFSWFIRRLFSGASPNFSSTLNFVYVSVSVSTSANYHMTTTAPSYLIFADQLMLNTLNVLLVAAEISTKKKQLQHLI